MMKKTICNFSRGLAGLALMATCAWPTNAWAQQLTVAVTALGSRGAQVLVPNEANPVGIAECNADTKISFRVSSIPGGASLLDFFRGSSCKDGRCVMTNTGCTHLNLNIPGIGGTNQQDINDLALTSLVDCSVDSFSTNVISIFAANTSPACDMVAGSTELSIVVDTQRPVAPGNVKGGNGQNSINISWSAINENNLLEYRVYLAQDGCASDSVLQPGGSIPDGFATVANTAGTGTSATVSGDQVGAIGDKATVAVAAVDRATNVGLLGTSCVQRVKTSSFCNAVDPVRGCPKNCGLGNFQSSTAPWALLMTFLALVVISNRRRWRLRGGA